MRCYKCDKDFNTLVQVSHKESDGIIYTRLFCVMCLFTPVYRGVKPVVTCDRMLTAANGKKYRNAEEMEEACWDEPDNCC